MSAVRGLTLPRDMAARFWARVDVRGPDECWPWRLSCQSAGYGQWRFEGELYLAHRVAWALTFGPVPEGKDLDHDCRSRPCCNPAHLVARTKPDHGARHSGEAARARGPRPFCKKGLHRMVGTNVIMDRRGNRRCRRCLDEWRAARCG